MKKVFLLLFSFFYFISFSQNVNNYEFVIVPTKFDFQQSENEYRLSTVLKFRLEEYGFTAFYSNDQMGMNMRDRCLFLNANIVDESGMFVTKLYIEFKDCSNNVIYKSAVGSTRTKDRKIAYNEALEQALLSVKNLNYKFEGKKSANTASLSSDPLLDGNEKTQIINENFLFAQPIANGFQLVDTTPKVVLKIFKTSQSEFYIANSESKNGVVFKRNNEWFFEYYVNEKLISEKLNIKF